MASNKFICIHGHFYQPPRENAWLEVVEMQDSAAPFHDWNERINYECYAPNTAARIEDTEGRIIKILNNYTKISFNFGPTLLSWMEKADPETYQAILHADEQSKKNFNGHGSAMAQAYNHMILPLSNERDRETQVIWGVKDFEHRFKRKPEGMWLPETAVDTDSLEVLAAHGIRFTVLSPRQAKSIRKMGEENWHGVNEHTIDTRRAYKCNLPSGKSIVIFYYHGDNSQGVAFKGYLNNGKYFASSLLDAFDDNEEAQLVHIATDGESYGHHHRYGEMALADCINHIEEKNMATIINYGAYLDLFPPEYETEIHDNSSWSCVHGVERWKSNCGCNSGGHPFWNQDWRAPLRMTLDWLRDTINPVFEQRTAGLLKNPWKARDAFIDVILDRSEKNVEAFIKKHSKRKLSADEKTYVLRWMEMQRNAMLMYTSCGWFFDEVSGIETNQIMQYANRVIYYARQVADMDLHDDFIERLKSIPSNVYENGFGSYEEHVMPARVDLTRVGMHYAASSLFEEYPEHLEFFNFISDSERFERIEAGNQKIATGRTSLKSRITHSRKQFSFVVLYLGQQNIIGYISTDMKMQTFEEMEQLVIKSFKNANLGEVIATMQSYFSSEKFTIWHLFRDEKRKILKQITDESLKKIETLFREVYNDNYLLMTGIKDSNVPIPAAYRDAVQFIVNQDIYNFFRYNGLNIRRLYQLTREFEKWNLSLTNVDSLKLAASERIYQELLHCRQNNGTARAIEGLIEIFDLLKSIGIEPDIWKSQNLFFSMLLRYQNGTEKYPDQAFEQAFLKLGEHLHVKTEMPRPVIA